MPKKLPGSVSRKLQNLTVPGSERVEAEEFLYRRYFGWLRQSAETGLAGLPAGIADPEQVALSTMFHVLDDIEKGGISVPNRTSLTGLLAKRLTARRSDELRRALASRRGTKVTDSLDAPLHGDGGKEDAGQLSDVVPDATESSLEALAIADIDLVNILKGLDATDQLIAAYAFIGLSQKQSAELIGTSDDIVQKRLRAVRTKIRDYFRDDAE